MMHFIHAAVAVVFVNEFNKGKLLSKPTEMLAVCEKPDMISFVRGLPNPTCFPAERMKQAFIQIMNNEGVNTLQY